MCMVTRYSFLGIGDESVLDIFNHPQTDFWVSTVSDSLHLRNPGYLSLHPPPLLDPPLLVISNFPGSGTSEYTTGEGTKAVCVCYKTENNYHPVRIFLCFLCPIGEISFQFLNQSCNKSQVSKVRGNPLFDSLPEQVSPLEGFPYLLLWWKL